jgi:ABC-type Fe3+-citrate transport system substrate-binding protein
MKRSEKAFGKHREMQKSLLEFLDTLGEIKEEAQETEGNEVFFVNENDEKIYLKVLKNSDGRELISITSKDMTITVDLNGEKY